MDLIDAAYNVVQDYPGGAASLAPRIGKNSTTLSHELTRQGTAKLGLLDAKKITDCTGDLRILYSWATDAGQMLVPLPEALLLLKDQDCLRRLAEVASKFAAVCHEVTAGLSDDGKISDNELSRIDAEIGNQIAALHSLREALARNNQANKPQPSLRAV
jgi:hypothetical protein